MSRRRFTGRLAAGTLAAGLMLSACGSPGSSSAPETTAPTGAASGGSAGACSSLWLAFHPDMADPKSADPISSALVTSAYRASTACCATDRRAFPMNRSWFGMVVSNMKPMRRSLGPRQAAAPGIFRRGRFRHY